MIEPSPATVATVDAVARHAEGWPITVGFFTLIALLAGFFYWLLFKFWPKWQDEQEKTRAQREAEGEKTRAHIQGLLSEKDKVAAALIADERAASRERHQELTEKVADRVVRVEGKVDRLSDKHEQLHAKVESVERRASAIAAKIGVSAVIVLALVGAATAAVLSVPQLEAALRVTIGAGRYPVMHHTHIDQLAGEPVALKCDPRCEKGFYCDTRSGKCKEETKGEAKKPGQGDKRAALPDGGHSSINQRLALLACHTSSGAASCVAVSLCDRRGGCL